MFDECYQAFAHTVEAMEAYKNPPPNQSVSDTSFKEVSGASTQSLTKSANRDGL